MNNQEQATSQVQRMGQLEEREEQAQELQDLERCIHHNYEAGVCMRGVCVCMKTPPFYVYIVDS